MLFPDLWFREYLTTQETKRAPTVVLQLVTSAGLEKLASHRRHTRVECSSSSHSLLWAGPSRTHRKATCSADELLAATDTTGAAAAEACSAMGTTRRVGGKQPGQQSDSWSAEWQQGSSSATALGLQLVHADQPMLRRVLW